MKILIFGLPGSGKTYLAERLQNYLQCAWFNADEIRKMANDWEFSNTARLRQAYRMKNLADFEVKNGRNVICDFVCPLNKTREIFNADYSIFMNTIHSGRFDDTNKIFEIPEKTNLVVNTWMKENEIECIAYRIREELL